MYVRGLIPSVLLQTLFGHWHLTKMQFVSFSTELVENSSLDKETVVEFKKFERRFKFNSRLKYGWFHLKLYQMFQD